MDYRKKIVATSQKQISLEIRSNSVVEIGINQSKMYKGISIPQCNNTVDAINLWIEKEEEKKKKTINFIFNIIIYVIIIF
jgi:hypothetical protein